MLVGQQGDLTLGPSAQAVRRRENDKMGIYYSFQKQFIENDFFSPSAGRIYYDTVWGCIY